MDVRQPLYWRSRYHRSRFKNLVVGTFLFLFPDFCFNLVGDGSVMKDNGGVCGNAGDMIGESNEIRMTEGLEISVLDRKIKRCWSCRPRLYDWYPSKWWWVQWHENRCWIIDEAMRLRLDHRERNMMTYDEVTNTQNPSLNGNGT